MMQFTTVTVADGTQPPISAAAPAPSYGDVMATKSTPSSQPKKPGRSLKEKRAAKHAKKDAQKQVRRGWEAR